LSQYALGAGVLLCVCSPHRLALSATGGASSVRPVPVCGLVRNDGLFTFFAAVAIAVTATLIVIARSVATWQSASLRITSEFPLANIVAIRPWSGSIALCLLTSPPRFIRHRRHFGGSPRAGSRRSVQVSFSHTGKKHKQKSACGN